LPSAQLPRDAFLALLRILRLEPREHGPDPVVQHQTSTLTIPSSTTTGNVSTGKAAGKVSAAPVRMSICDPCRGQTANPSSMSKSPSQSGPSSCEHRSSIAYSSPFRLWHLSTADQSPRTISRSQAGKLIQAGADAEQRQT
jgi:hypothetical protein